jgi:hypothetical protein
MCFVFCLAAHGQSRTPGEPLRIPLKIRVDAYPELICEPKYSFICKSSSKEKAMPKKKATKKKVVKKATKKKVAKKATKKKVAKKATKKKVAKKATKKKVVKKATKKKVAKKATKKKVVKKATKKKAKTKRKPNAAFMAPMNISPALAAVIGAKPMPRTEVTKKLWVYIKKNDLQDSVNRRNINADDKLKKVFGKKQVSMFEMTKLVSKHLSKD